MIADRNTAPHEDSGPCPQGGFGAVLRRTREAQGLDIPAIAGRLKIRTIYLRALEEEDIAALPARPFAIGFLRSYARLLGLDADSLVAALKRMLDEPDSSPLPGREATPSSAPTPAPAAGADPQETRKERSATLLISPLFFVMAALGLGFALPASAPPAEGQARLAAAATEQAPPVSQQPGEATKPAVPQTAPEKSRSASARAADRTDRQVADESAQSGPGRNDPLPAAPVAFRLRAGAWVLVKDGRGRPLWSGMLSAGQLWTPPEGAVQMTTTHPGNLILLLDGIEKGALGVAAQPLLDIPLARPALLAFLAERKRQSRLVRAAR